MNVTPLPNCRASCPPSFLRTMPVVPPYMAVPQTAKPSPRFQRNPPHGRSLKRLRAAGLCSISLFHPTRPVCPTASLRSHTRRYLPPRSSPRQPTSSSRSRASPQQVEVWSAIPAAGAAEGAAPDHPACIAGQLRSAPDSRSAEFHRSRDTARSSSTDPTCPTSPTNVQLGSAATTRARGRATRAHRRAAYRALRPQREGRFDDSSSHPDSQRRKGRRDPSPSVRPAAAVR